MSEVSNVILEATPQQPKLETDNYIKVGMATCGLAAGAEEVYNILVNEIRKRQLPIKVCKCGCIGMCYAEPLVEVKVTGLPVVRYGKVTKEIALRIVERHIVEKMLINDYIYDFGVMSDDSTKSSAG